MFWGSLHEIIVIAFMTDVLLHFIVVVHTIIHSHVLEDQGQYLVGHLLTVDLPELAILLGTPLIVPNRPMDEEKGEKYEVKVRHNAYEEGRNAPRESCQKLGHIVKVTRHSPPAGD